ncbi:uncharacterized protein LOC110633308 [Hevea brasiliensis]|uniref:uncharacterized protein LOC110633308 n=1 Tax=Hevea brasiliensis TaxID=3981 RepID=UPI0025D7289A|nr:uncharacterized protein LOC110633308 [Hevea brasiliensis]
MHDVVRDVAKSMTSDVYFVKAGGEKFEWPKIENLKRYSAISIMENQIPEYPASWDCPNLQILLLSDERSQLAMPEGVLKGMKTLKVLHLKRRSDAFLPGTQHLFISHNSTFGLKHSIRENSTFVHLTNLRTLILQYYGVGDISALGELKLLQILSFKNCCHDDAVDYIFPPNVISSLSQVQELYMLSRPRRLGRSFGAFERFNITELKSLPGLTAFMIFIKNFEYIPEGFSFPDLEVFKISIGDGKFSSKFSTKINYLSLRGPIKDPTMAVNRLRCIKPLLRRTNYLYLSEFEGLKNIFPSLFSDRDSLAVLRSLNISFCSELEYLIDAEEWEIPPTTQQQHFNQCPKLSNVFASLNPQLQLKELEVLQVDYCDALEYIFEKKEDAPPCLRELKLDCLIGLKHIYKGSTELLDLCNLEFLEIKECNKLKVILPASAAQRLGKLKELHLHNCDQLEAVLAKRQEGEDTCENLVFSQLRVLSLVNLPNLTGFCTDYTLTFKWPSLEKVEVVRCPKMQMFAAVVASDGDSSTPKLKMIEVDGVDIMLDGTDINRVMQGRYKDKDKLSPHDTTAAKEALCSVSNLRKLNDGELPSSVRRSQRSLTVWEKGSHKDLASLFPESFILLCLTIKKQITRDSTSISPKTEIVTTDNPFSLVFLIKCGRIFGSGGLACNSWSRMARLPPDCST